MKTKLLLLKGLPASGKSTFAKKLNEQNWVRVNKDDMREMLFGKNWKPKNEKQILRIRDLIIQDCLSNNKNVVVDDTNLNDIHEKTLRVLAEKNNAEFQVNDSFLGVPIEVCIERDLHRDRSVGERVIRGMYNQYLSKPIEAITYDESLPYVVLVDIDGTLAHMTTRKRFGKLAAFSWKDVGEDDVDPAVAFLTDALAETHRTKVVILSGRDSVCRPETEDWLDRNDIEYDALYMRSINDNRKDTIIKRELYETYIKGKYNVLAVIDDRPSVCRMWRDELGLKVLQVGDPYAEF